MIEYEFIGFLLFCIHVDLEFVLIHKAKEKKKTLASIQPHILTSHMVDNAYLFSCKMLFGEGITSHWKRCLVVGWALARLSTKLLIKLVISHKLELKPLKKPVAWRIKQTPLYKLKNSKPILWTPALTL